MIQNNLTLYKYATQNLAGRTTHPTISKAVNSSTGLTIDDIDCGMENVLIEVKKSVSSVDVEQLYKYVNYDDERYINVLNNKVMSYIDEAIENPSVMNQEKLQSIEKMGVTILNGLDELKGVLK